MIWDGLSFFGFDDTKLARLKGKPIQFRDKVFSTKWSTKILTLISIVVFVLAVNLSKLDTVKSQGVQLRSQYSYEFNHTEQVSFVSAVYFWTDELFPIVDKRFPSNYTDFSDS